MKISREFEKAVEERTGGQVDIKWYPGGVLGDEYNLIKLIKIGQLHGAGITGMGAGYIDMSLRVLEIPFLVRDYRQVDTLLNKVLPILKKRAERKGFVILEPTEAGFVYFFSVTHTFRTLDDIKGCKLWVWGDDPFAVEVGKQVPGLIPIPLAMTELLLGLKSGLVDCIYFTPMAVVAFQLHTALKHMTDFPITYGSGWMVMGRKFFYSLPHDVREILLEEAHRHFSRLRLEVRKSNRETKKALQAYGIKIVKPSPKLKEELDKIRVKSVREFTDKFMPEEIKQFLSKEFPEIFSSH